MKITYFVENVLNLVKFRSWGWIKPKVTQSAFFFYDWQGHPLLFINLQSSCWGW